MMTTPKCPLCGKLLKLSTIENKGQLHFFACYKCNYQLRMSPRKDFALEYAEKFISKFPPIMRVNPGDFITYLSRFGERFDYAQIYEIDSYNCVIQTSRGTCRPDDVLKWPWELEQKGGQQ